jgi:hypothetical protein
LYFASSSLAAKIMGQEQVPSWRPRIVNPAEVQYERKQWATWHEQQTSAEREMMNADNPHLFQKEDKGVSTSTKSSC